LPEYRPYNDLRDPAAPRHATTPELWRQAYEVVAQGPTAAPARLIHRDYHPGNTLWSDGRLTGVVDWSYASRGPVSADLGHMRWNLAVDYGQRAADDFLAAYLALRGDFTHDPYWDLRAVVDLLPESPDDPLPADMVAGLEAHLAQAMARL
jgi:aminoglycoside phosphotransferase (APT) family kinase protein